MNRNKEALVEIVMDDIISDFVEWSEAACMPLDAEDDPTPWDIAWDSLKAVTCAFYANDRENNPVWFNRKQWTDRDDDNKYLRTDSAQDEFPYDNER